MKVEDGIYMIKNNELYSINFPERWKANVVTVKIDKKVEFERMTKADRIRSMTDEELANMWVSYVDCGECPAHRECNMLPQDCLRLALEWLKKEVDDG